MPLRVTIPPKVKEKISVRVTELADAHGYLTQKRPSNGLFIERLVNDPEVGEKLGEFLEKSRIKSYIKDVFIKEYSEAKRSTSIDVSAVVSARFHEAELVERKGAIHKFSSGGTWIIVTCASFRRWEIGVKKLALAASIFPSGGAPRMVLLLHTEGHHANAGDKRQAEQAIVTLGIEVIWC